LTEKIKLLLDIPYEIESARLLIKRYEEGDAKDLFALLERNDNREFLKEHVDEATKRAVKFIFEDLKATKIHLLTRDTNERSYKLAERLGFMKEGHDRENIRHEGKMIGLFHFGLLRREYLENPDYTKDIEK